MMAPGLSGGGLVVVVAVVVVGIGAGAPPGAVAVAIGLFLATVDVVMAGGFDALAAGGSAAVCAGAGPDGAETGEVELDAIGVAGVAGDEVGETGNAPAFCRIDPVTEFEALFDRRDARIQPVAVAVQRIDGGGQSPCLVLAFLGHPLDLLRLAHEIGGGNLLAPQPHRGLVGVKRDDHRGNRADPPRSQSPQRAPVDFVFLGQKSVYPAAGIVGRKRVSPLLAISSHTTSLALPRPGESHHKH